MNVSGVETDYQTAQANCAASGGHLLILKSRDVDAPVLRDVLTAAGKHFSNMARCGGSGDGGGGSGVCWLLSAAFKPKHSVSCRL